MKLAAQPLKGMVVEGSKVAPKVAIVVCPRVAHKIAIVVWASLTISLCDFNTQLSQLEEEMEHNNKQLQNEMEALDARITWVDEECPDNFDTWKTHHVLEN